MVITGNYGRKMGFDNFIYIIYWWKESIYINQEKQLATLVTRGCMTLDVTKSEKSLRVL